MSYGNQQYSSVPFGQANMPLELPNLKDVKWKRTVDSGVADMTMTLYNTQPLPIGEPPQNNDLDQPGFYSPLRGVTAHSSRWSRTANGWQDWLVPDRIIRCVDTETEILTKRGWLAWDQVAEGDETLGINPATGNAEWQSIVEVFRAPFVGELTRLKTRTHDSLTTGNHRWLTKRYGKFDWRTTETLDRHSYIPLAVSQAKDIVASYSDDFVELAAWYYTEGTADHRLRGLDSGGSISQSEIVNPQNSKRIRDLMYRMYGTPGPLPRGPYVPQEIVDEAIRLRQRGMAVRDVAEKLGVSNISVYRWASGKRANTKVYKWRDGHTRPGQNCFVFTQEVARELRKVICGPDKIPSPEFLTSLTQSQLRLFIDVSILGDGTGSETFLQNEVRVKAFEFACALAGQPTHTKKHGSCRAVTLLRQTVTSPHDAAYQGDRRANGVMQEPYEGHVWCPRVKHKNWLARRNGSVFYTGNTYEGYGFDASVAPEVDTHLYQSGTWRIDDVDFTHDGIITVTCRDIGSILLDQILFPPIVPFASYPLWFETAHDVKNPDIVTSTGGMSAGWVQPHYETSSNLPYVGNGGSVYGHTGPDAFDTSDATYWLSIGNARPDADYSFEFIQGKFTSQKVSGVRFRVWGGPYTCYVSVFAGGKWQGDQTVPYNPNDPVSAPNGSNIRFVTRFHVNNEETKAVAFKAIAGATKIRLTFTNLCNSGIGTYRYRAGVRSFKVSGAVGTTVTTTTPGGTHIEPLTAPPRIYDYTDIPKLVLAYAGFYWPREATHAFRTYSNGTRVTTVAPSDDRALVKGRVWGDFEETGTAPLVAIPMSVFDKKPVMDCVLAGTLVKVPGGHRPIEDLRLGDVVANRGGYGRVTGRKSQLATSVVATVIDGEQIVTSAGHLFWTVRGWVRADELKVGDEVRQHSESLRMVRSGVHGNTDTQGSEKDMFGSLSTGIGGETQDAQSELCLSSVRGGVQRGLGEEVLLPAVLCGGSNFRGSDLRGLWRVVSSHGGSAGRMFDEVSSESDGESSLGRSLGGAVHALASTGRRLVSRVLDVSSGNRRGYCVDASGSGQSSDEGGCRGGRSRPCSEGQAREGSTARRMAHLARVDRTEVLRQGDPGWTALCDEHGEVVLWDLSVDGDPSFTVGKGEFVVHNCITYVKDIVGYLFFIDEGGGAVFRSPNIWSVGNWIGNGGPNSGRTTTVVVIDETTTLMGLGAKMSGRSIREKVFVANVSGQIAAMSNGHNPYPSGLRRVGGFTDQHFATTAECQIMADLITLRQLFTYRTDKVTIPGNPAIQVDDQVRVYERVSEEAFLQYVIGISMNWSLETGKYTYDLDTHWLGDTAFSAWTFNPANLSVEARQYLRSIGKIP
jgi:hypothetical protein